MAGAFGFQKMPQRPAPDGQAVGMALIQQGQQPQQAPPQPMMAPQEPAYGDEQEAALRRDGAQRMGAPGQMHDVPTEGAHSANALNVAVGEALTRVGSGYETNADPYKPHAENARQLMHLGLSDVEAQLLIKTGGV